MRREETLPGLLGERAGGAPALVGAGGDRMSFAELGQRANRVAGGLAELGVGNGDRVALWLPNCPEWLVLHLALARLGAVSVAINTRYRAHEVQDILSRSEASALAVWPGLKDFEAILEDVDAPPLILRKDELPEGDPAPDASHPDAPLIVFTSSGTTGKPKLVVHTHRTITRHARAVARGFRYDRDGCVVLGMLPLCGVFGYDSAMGALAGGAPVVLQPIFDAEEALALATRHRVTHANGSDAMCLRLLAAGTPPALEELGFAAFEGDPVRVIEAADAAGITAYMCYGSTEVQALLAHATGSPEERAVAGGTPVSPDTEVRVGDDGELEIRGPSVMVGYLGDEQPDLTEDGFLRTGDLGHLTDGGFAFSARRGDALRLGGYLVDPREIEAFLEAQDGVAQAGVVAAEVDGAQRAVAFVVGDVDESTLIESCRASLAGFKAPRRVIALDELPTTDSANGRKVRRAELRRLAAEALTPHEVKERDMASKTPGATQATDPPRTGGADGASGDGAIDYARIAATPEFKELHESRRRFVMGGTLTATAALLIVFGLYGFAPDAMGEPAVGSVTWALVLGFGLVLLSFVMAAAFARASRKWDGMVARMMEEHDRPTERTGRFGR